MDKNDVKTLESYKHVLWYAKHCYLITDTLEDLKKILIKRCGCDIEDMHEKEVYDQVIIIFIAAFNNDQNTMYRFFQSIFENSSTGAYKESVKRIDIIESVLQQLKYLVVKEEVDEEWINIVDMGEPDFTILGPSEDTGYMKWFHENLDKVEFKSGEIELSMNCGTPIY